MKFSVIVPLYNKAEYIERTLQSILNQSYRSFELIVVDDGSTDDSYIIAESLLRDIANARIAKQKNSGVAVARNHGVELSNGEYVCFLDSDDWWDGDFLKEMSGLIERYPNAGLYGSNFFLVKDGKNKVAPIGFPYDFKEGYINYCQVYAKTLCMPISSSSVAIPRDAFLSAGQFRAGLKLGEDFDLWIRLAMKYPVAMINKPLAYYYQDIPAQKRATRNLYDPRFHMLWNLDYLAEQEAENKDLKILLDRLRSSGLLRYYLSRQYHEATIPQLEKVDWQNVSSKEYKLYHSSLAYQRIRFKSIETAVAVKKFCLQKLLTIKNN